MRLFYACAVTPPGGGPGRTEGASEAATALQTELGLGLGRSAHRVQHRVGLPLPCILSRFDWNKNKEINLRSLNAFLIIFATGFAQKVQAIHAVNRAKKATTELMQTFLSSHQSERRERKAMTYLSTGMWKSLAQTAEGRLLFFRSNMAEHKYFILICTAHLAGIKIENSVYVTA